MARAEERTGAWDCGMRADGKRLKLLSNMTGWAKFCCWWRRQEDRTNTARAIKAKSRYILHGPNDTCLLGERSGSETDALLESTPARRQQGPRRDRYEF